MAYIPSPKYGVLVQYVTSSPNRDDAVNTFGVVKGVDGKRTDMFLRGFLRKRDDGLGPMLDVVLARSAFSNDTIKQGIGSVTATASFRTPTLSAAASAAYRTRWTTVDLGASAGWTPSPKIGINANAAYQLLTGSRSSTWVGAQASISPFSHIILKANGRVGSVVQAPSIETDTAQSVLEGTGSIGWESRLLGVEVGLTRTAAWNPMPYQETGSVVATIAPSASTNWFFAKGRLTPVNWIAIDAWYSSPTGIVPEGVPPEHFRLFGTVRSRFLRTFPSGAFDLKASIGLERWGEGVLGSTVGGAPYVLPAQMYLETMIEVRIQAFAIYFSRANLLSELPGYVPNFPVQPLATTFGVRWGFLN